MNLRDLQLMVQTGLISMQFRNSVVKIESPNLNLYSEAAVGSFILLILGAD